ncbi:MAG: hypothetical protein ABI601_18155 [bacterium]
MIRRLAALLLLLAAPASLAAQHALTPLDSLGDATSRAIVRYADRSAASAAGYRRIGADFPGMGEHWLQPRVLLSGRVDATQPTILIYATIDGAPRLLGAGFVVTTRGDERAAAVPGWPNAWHEHSGLLSDESGVSPGANAASATHAWVLHVWTTLANPGGRYAPDNWALPFVRAGLGSPAHADADAGRAAALTSTGDEYLRDLLSDAGLRDSANAVRVDSIIATSRARARVIVGLARARPGGAATDEALDALRAEWASLSLALRGTVGETVARYLAPPHSASMTAHRHAD